jgi:hypothetical protein
MKKTAFLLISSLLVSQSASSMGPELTTDDGKAYNKITTSITTVNKIDQKSDVDEHEASEQAKSKKHLTFSDSVKSAGRTFFSSVKMIAMKVISWFKG